MSLSMILKFFLTFGRLEPCDSYKLYSYKKESVDIKRYLTKETYTELKRYARP